MGLVPTTSSNAGSSNAATAAKPQTIGAGSAVGFGLQNLTASGGGSAKTIVLSGLAQPPLFPGSSVKITFSFANSGDATLTVPVQLAAATSGQTLPAESGSPAA